MKLGSRIPTKRSVVEITNFLSIEMGLYSCRVHLQSGVSIYIFFPVSRHSLPSGAPRAYVDDGCSRRRLADVSAAFRRVRAGAYCCMPCAICRCSNLVRIPLLYQRRESRMPALAMTTGISSALCVGFQYVSTERLRTTQNSVSYTHLTLPTKA